MSLFSIRPGCEADFEELMEVLNRCFCAPGADRPRFEQLFPDLQAATDDSMQHNLLAFSEGKIVGCAGVFPVSIWTDQRELVIGGIGGVCVLPHYRQQGVMSALMDQAGAVMKERQYPFAWLSGDRERYGRWGFERVVNELRYLLGRRRAENSGLEDEEGWTITKMSAEEADWEAIWSELQRVPYYSVWGRKAARLKYLRQYHHSAAIWRAERNGVSGHVLANIDELGIYGWGGEPAAVGAAVRAVMAGCEGALNVGVPPWDDVYRQVFDGLRGDCHLECRGNLAILDLKKTLTAYLDYLTEKVREMELRGRAVLTMKDELSGESQSVLIEAEDGNLTISSVKKSGGDDGVEIILSPREMVNLLFSQSRLDHCEKITGKISWLLPLLGLPFYLPDRSHL